MRTVTFSDERVIDRLNRQFICVWSNIRPKQRFRDGLYDGKTAAQLAKEQQPGDGSDNICAHFTTAEAKILHVGQGYHDPDRTLRELEFALELRKLAPERLPAAYEARCVELARERGRDEAARLMYGNLAVLAKEPLPGLGAVLQSERAGLRTK